MFNISLEWQLQHCQIVEKHMAVLEYPVRVRLYVWPFSGTKRLGTFQYFRWFSGTPIHSGDIQQLFKLCCGGTGLCSCAHQSWLVESGPKFIWFCLGIVNACVSRHGWRTRIASNRCVLWPICLGLSEKRPPFLVVIFRHIKKNGVYIQIATSFMLL